MEMFDCELKFVIEICKKWMTEKFMRKKCHLDMRSKQEYKKKNPADFSSTKCVICNFNIALATTNGPFFQDMTYSDFVVKKEHHFLRNILDPDELKLSKNIRNIEVYFAAFEKFIKIIAVLANRYRADNDIAFIEEDFLAESLANSEITSFRELFFEIWQTDVEIVRTFKKTKLEQIKMISFAYMRIMDFPGDYFDNKTLVSKYFFDSVLNLIFGDVVLHHSHINGRIFGYAHNFCNQEVKE